MAKQPKILSNMIRDVRAKGKSTAEATRISVANLQRAGDLKPGSTTATSQGIRRGKMTPAQQLANPIRKLKTPKPAPKKK